MKSQGYRTALYFLILSFALATPSQAIRKSQRASRLAGKNRLELGFGIRHHGDNQNGIIVWDNDGYYAASNGAFGSIALSHFDNENLAYALTYTVHDVETDSWVNSYGYYVDETTVVHSIMFGVRYYLPQSRPYSSMRPYFSASAGPVIGSVEYRESDYCDCEQYTETDHTTVLGARLGGGVDLQMGRRFLLGLNAGYNFFEDFDHPIAGRYDYSGSEFGVSFSFLFGR